MVTLVLIGFMNKETKDYNDLVGLGVDSIR